MNGLGNSLSAPGRRRERHVLVFGADAGPGSSNMERNPRPPFLSRGCDRRHRRSRFRPVPEDRIRLRGHRSEGAGLRGGQGAFISGTAAVGARSSWAGHRSRTILHQCFERMGVHGEERTGLPPQEVALPLHALFLSVAATKGYEEILTCVLAAEWMYLTWCSTANQSPSLRDSIRGWVALHAGGAFADHVAWVRSEIDDRVPALTDSRQARLSALFEKVLEVEIAFHDAAYTA